jgi:hypothetical protein
LSLSCLAPAAAAPVTGDAGQLLSDLERDSVHRAALAGSIGKARDALTRAKAMDRAGDARHAALLRAAAREWIDGARDLARATDAEAKAEQAEKAVDDLETKRVRGRALLEETIARRGRASALLEQLEREPKPSAPVDAKKAPPSTKASAKPVAPTVAAPPPTAGPKKPAAPSE